MSAWSILELERTRDARAIRRAYARKLRVTQPEDDPAGFQALREAYEQALMFADRGVEFSLGDLHFDRAELEEAAPDQETGPGGYADGVKQPESAADPGPDAAGTLDDIRPGSEALERLTDHAARARLVELVRAEPEATQAALTLAFEDFMSGPELQNIDGRAAAELWVARMIAAEAPRSHPLLVVANKAFRWNHGRDVVRRDELDEAVEAVFERREALGYLKDLRLKRHPQHLGLVALSAPPPRSMLAYTFRPSPLAAIRMILRRIDEEYPQLEEDLPHLQAWRDWLAVPRLSPTALWVAILAAPLVGLLAQFSSPDFSGLLFLTAGLAGGLGVLALSFAHLYAILWPRRLWRERWEWRASPWLAYGWAPASGVLILISAFVPLSLASLVGQSLAAVVVLVWCAITGDPDRREAGRPWWIRLAMLGVYYVIWMVLAAIRAPEIVMPMLPALAVGGAVASLGSHSLLIAWCAMIGDRARLAGAALLIGLLVVILALIIKSPEYPAVLPLVLALTAIAALSSRPLAETLDGAALTARHWIGWLGLVGLINAVTIGTSVDLILTCVWILAGPTIVIMAATGEALRDVRRS